MRISSSMAAYGYLVLAELAVGVSVVSGKFIADYMHAFFFIGGRFLIATVILGAALRVTRQSIVSAQHPTGRLTLHDWGWLGVQGLTGGMLFNVLFYFGVTLTTATSAGIIGSTLPAIATLCAFFMLGEALNARKLTALAFAMLGIVILGLDNAQGSHDATGGTLGDCLVLLAMFPEAIFMIFAKKISQRVTPLGSATLVNFIGLMTLLPFSLYGLTQTQLATIPMTAWAALLLGGVSGVFFFWAWAKGLALGVPVSLAALFGGLMPVFTAIIAYFCLGEKLTLYNLLGMLFVFFAIGVGAGMRPQRLSRRLRYEIR